MKYLGVLMVLYFVYSIYQRVERMSQDKIVITTEPCPDGVTVTYIERGDTLTKTMTYSEFENFLK